MSRCYYVQTTWLDIHLRVPFLCTQVKSLALHDCTKIVIVIVIDCLKNTVQLPFVSGTDSNEILTLYIPASFAVHPESSSHIGIYITLVHGSILSLSSKQKSNGKSSPKTRFIGVDNTMTLDMLMEKFYIAIQYFCIIN